MGEGRRRGQAAREGIPDQPCPRRGEVLHAVCVRGPGDPGQDRQVGAPQGARAGVGSKAVRSPSPASTKAAVVSVRGRPKGCLRYKVRRRGMLVIAVPSPRSSRERAACGHVHPDDRASHRGFIGQRCDRTVHAGDDGAQVRARRRVRATWAGRWVSQEPRPCRITRVQVGAAGIEPRAAAGSSTLDEVTVRGRAGNTSAHGS